jgi:cardiolipin synthase A/B
MRSRRYVMRRRQAGGVRALAVGLAGAALSADIRAEECRAHAPARVLPANALPPPGAPFEGYPSVGRAQKVRIAEESLAASARALVQTPLDSAAQVGGRTAERLIIRAREAAPRPRFNLAAHLAPDADDLGGTAGGPPVPARLTLLPSSEASVQALLGLIATAERRIDLMMYGWDDDPTGREVAEALAVRARRGVPVRLLVDRTGFLIHNAAVAHDRPTFLDALRTVPNVTVIEPPGAFFRFDHRKLALIDGRIAWSGGMILTEVARRRWHNLAFLAEGPIVAAYAQAFEERWSEVGGCPAGPNPVLDAWRPCDRPNASVRLIATDVRARSLKAAIYHAVDHARHHIYLENPYFSDEVLTDKLVAARKRGVDVCAVLTLRGNVRRLNRYETLTANRLLRGGVRVWLYPAMTHVKAMSADGVWAYLGTGNFDELSLRNNREIGLSVTSPEVVGQLDRSVFLPDMADSQELTDLLPMPRGRLFLELFALWY